MAHRTFSFMTCGLYNIKLKRFHAKGESEGVPSTAIREICFLKSLRHSSIVDLLDVLCVNSNLYLIFEYLDIDLKKYIDNMQQKMSEKLLKSYIKQLMEGINYLHTHRILHRDLKPQNLLLDKEGHIKLADFGLSRCFSLPTRVYTHEVVTLWYRAPELLLGAKIYCTGIDMWSIGCIMAEMITRTALFPGDSEIFQLFQIFKTLGTPNETIWPGVSGYPDFKPNFPQWELRKISEIIIDASEETRDFLDKLLVYNPFDRLSAQEALKTPYLKNVRLTCPDMDCFPTKD